MSYDCPDLLIEAQAFSAKLGDANVRVEIFHEALEPHLLFNLKVSLRSFLTVSFAKIFKG